MRGYYPPSSPGWWYLNVSYLLPLKGLKILELRDCSLAGFVDNQERHYLSNLEELYLDSNPLQNNFIQSMGALSSLKVLSLKYGLQFLRVLPSEGWCKLKNLEELDLGGNYLEGSIPSCLGNLTSLRLLDLSYNLFTGNIASSPLPQLTSLEYLSLEHNKFQIPVSFHPFANLSNLKVLLSDENELIPESSPQRWRPKFKLQFLTLSNCRPGGISLTLTHSSFLHHQNDLRFISLSHNNFGGNFPSWLLNNNSRLEHIFLRNNSFVGRFELPSHRNPSIRMIDLSNNNLQGPIPINISSTFPNLNFLVLGSNEFQGNIPPELFDLFTLLFLDLSRNQFSGGLPEQIGMYMYDLILSNNNLSGQIFPTTFNSTRLEYLSLAYNNFVGYLPDMSSNTLLSALDCSNNHFSGELPSWIGNMSSELVGIDLSNNHFEGSIPLEFCQLNRLFVFYLSGNNLSGPIPSCFSPPHLKHARLCENSLTGPMTDAFNSSFFLVTLDLSYNDLTGTIPSWLGNLSELSILDLKANRFHGNISVQFCRMSQLTILDLSHNDLSGLMPSCLGNLTFDNKKKFVKILETNFLTLDEFEESAYQHELRERFTLSKSGTFLSIDYLYSTIDVPHNVTFTTKNMSLTYSGGPLDFMSGIDVSSNRFSGEIPIEIGNLSKIRALNLSHNNFTGSIPKTFGNLKQTESLDMSYNNLGGNIPYQLIELTSLQVFSVAHNNLSGATPERKDQFGTFDGSCYEGNPLLCGPPLNKSCEKAESPLPHRNDKVEEDRAIDIEVFYVSFSVAYATVLLGIIAVLCINPQWRQFWFYFVEVFINSCYILYKKIVSKA